MNSIVIASKDITVAQEIKEFLDKDQDVAIVSSEEEIGQHLRTIRLFLLDHSFNEKIDTPLLINIIKKAPFPVLLLTAPNDGNYAIEAMKHGARNFIVKSGDYHPLLKHTIQQAIDEFNEKQKMKQTIAALKKRVDGLESRLQEEDEKPATNVSHVKEPDKCKTNILEEIIFVFKRGEIDLPSPPQISIKFKDLINKGANMQDIGDLLSKDVAVSLKLISISNSAYYRGVTINKNLTQAISRLGINTTRQYADAILNRTMYSTQNKRFRAFIENLWEHSLSCAYAAQITANLLKLELPSDPFTLGLLHDIGKLVLFQVIAELQMKNKLGGEVDTAEILETVNMNHGRFGASLMKLWKFSSEFVKVAAYHDKIDQADFLSKELLVVNVANQIVKTMGFGQEEPIEIDIQGSKAYKHLELN
ncbi:MAG TPA: HDOD domain-containing protein, partial [Deltaproteobacteria bacterium]|nr:HDOD domain-containing protein [Deltaproteobacteria bacterium]